MSERTGGIADDGDAGGDMCEDDRAGPDPGAGPDLASGDDAGARAHEHAFADLDVAGDIAMRAGRHVSADDGVVADGRAQVQDHKIAQRRVGGHDRARTEHDAPAQLDAFADLGHGMDKGQEFRPGRQQCRQKLLLVLRQGEAVEV